MKTLYVSCLLTASLAIAAQASQIYLLDFNNAGDAGGYPGGASAWNAYAAPSNVTGTIADTSGSTAGGLSIAHSGLNNSGNGGSTVFNNPDGGPSWVTTDGSLANTAAASDYFWTSNSSIQSFTVTFSGFTIGQTVSLDIFAARNGDPSAVRGFYSYSIDGGTNWFGFDVLEKDGTAATAAGWDTNNTLEQTFSGASDGNDAARYMNISDVQLTDTTLMIRGQDVSGSWTPLNAVRLAVIPEASTYGMIAGALAFGLVVLRRRRA